MKLLRNIIEIIFFFLAFLSPFLAFCIAAGLSYLFNPKQFILPALFILAGIVVGFLFANYVRRKYGSSGLFGLLLRLPEDDKRNESKYE